MASANPGHILASQVDSEVAKFRGLKEEIGRMRSDLQLVLGQRTENEMVLQELELVGDSVVYKKIGPVLIKQDLSEAQDTVKKRLEYITNERKQLEEKIGDSEKRASEIAAKVQQMQAQLQQTTAEAVRAISQQHNAGP